VDLTAQPSITLVLTTLEPGADATAFAQTLVAERLAACVSVLPGMRSVYRWKGTVESADEQLLVIKTADDRLEALEARVRELHSYEVPEFLVVPVKGASQSYIAWLLESVG
jgi:periplasmic divalent cation tolerance protein